LTAGGASRTLRAMHALRLHAPGRVDDLRYEDVEAPRPAAGEVLVSVHAAALTRHELEWPTDRLPAIPSYELSGVVAALGPGVAGIAVGDEVFSLTGFERDGAAAELATVPADRLAPKPRTLSHVESAALPLAALTAWQGLLVHGGLQPGSRVLITGATGGVGHLAVQLARVRGAHVVAATGPESRERARELGADETVGYTGGEVAPVDLVFDTAGGHRLTGLDGVLREGGTLVSIAEEPPPSRHRTVYFVVEPDRGQLAEIAALADGGRLRPAIDRTYALADAHAAFEHLARGTGRGKVVLEIAPE
jgi:NADPH:quinone reductase-like Zn-dependent oxidoreductase